VSSEEAKKQKTESERIGENAWCKQKANGGSPPSAATDNQAGLLRWPTGVLRRGVVAVV